MSPTEHCSVRVLPQQLYLAKLPLSTKLRHHFLVPLASYIEDVIHLHHHNTLHIWLALDPRTLDSSVSS
eukprot:5456927-Pyramimonas_sp.AAC.1